MTTKRKKKSDDEDYFAFVDEEMPRRSTMPHKGQWPDIVPILTVDDICHNYANGVGGTHDLSGWLDVVFECAEGDADVNPCRRRAERSLLRVLREHSGEKRNRAVWEYCAGDDYAETFLLHYYTKKFLARCWNEAMRQLGYEFPEEKCKVPVPMDIPEKRAKAARIAEKKRRENVRRKMYHLPEKR